MSNGRRQPSRGGTSRMTRECQVRICERLGVKFPGPTRHLRRINALATLAACPLCLQQRPNPCSQRTVAMCQEPTLTRNWW